jgi:membrane protein
MRFFADGCSYRAAALTYTTLLSLAPLMAVSFVILSAFPFFQSLTIKAQHFVLQYVVADSRDMIEHFLQNAIKQISHLPWIGFSSLVIIAVLMIFNMEQAFNTIWHVKKQRQVISAFLLYLAVLIFAPVLLGLGLLLSAYVKSLPLVTTFISYFGLAKIILLITPFCLSVFAFTFLYVAIPNCRVPLRYGFAAAIVAAILYETAKFSFTYYIQHFSSYALLYGALAVLPIFLLWLYISWVIILLGVVISCLLTERYQYSSRL